MSKIDDLHPCGKFLARLEGVISGVIPSDTVGVLEWVVDKDKIMSGADYEATAKNQNDRVSLQVVHPIHGVLDEFAKALFVRKEYRKELYGARLVAGLIIRVIYENNGPSDVEFNMNLDMHERV